MLGVESSGSSGRCFPSDYSRCNAANKRRSTWGYCYVLTRLRVHSSFRSLIRQKLWTGVTHRLCWGFASKQHRSMHHVLRAQNSSCLGHLHMTTPKLEQQEDTLLQLLQLYPRQSTMTIQPWLWLQLPESLRRHLILELERASCSLWGSSAEAPILTILPSAQITLASLQENENIQC